MNIYVFIKNLLSDKEKMWKIKDIYIINIHLYFSFKTGLGLLMSIIYVKPCFLLYFIK